MMRLQKRAFLPSRLCLCVGGAWRRSSTEPQRKQHGQYMLGCNDLGLFHSKRFLFSLHEFLFEALELIHSPHIVAVLLISANDRHGTATNHGQARNRRR